MTEIIATDSNVSTMLSMSISDPLVIGTHQIEYREDMTMFAHFFQSGPVGPAWTSFSPNASGQIDMTTVDNRILEGAFAFVLQPFGGGATSAKRITDGTFTVTR